MFNPQSIAGDMYAHIEDLDRAINRVVYSWDDRVAASVRADSVNQLMQSAQQALGNMQHYGGQISSHLAEMEALVL